MADHASRVVRADFASVHEKFSNPATRHAPRDTENFAS
jgi:hypothetical protein